MKKLLEIIILVFFLSLTANANAKWGEEFKIKEKSGDENFSYNLSVIRFNHFIDKYSEEFGNCKPASSPSFFLDYADCTYIELKKIFRETVGNDDQRLLDINHNYYKRLKNAARQLTAMLGAKVSTEIIFDKWEKDFINFTNSYFDEIKYAYKKYAEKRNREYLAYKNNKEDKGIDIPDNEIIAASSGTGFLVSKEGLMVTNYHVIEGCSEVKAIYNGNEFVSKILAIDKVNDLAIIKAEIKSKRAYSISNEDGQLLEEVIVAGYPLGKKISAAIKATSGTITALAGLGDNYAEFQTDAALNSGNSGGPIINELGNVVGVAVSKIQQEGVDSFNFGIKASVLKIFANSNDIKFLAPNNKEMKKKDLGSLITEATIYLDCWMTGKKIKELLTSNKNSNKAFYSKIIK